MSISDLGTLVQRTDYALAPYYFFLHGWMTFGESETWLRLPSILAAVGSVVLTAILAREVAGAQAAIATGSTMALHPLLAEWSAIARPYAIATFFAALSTLLLYRVTRRGGNWALWIGYTLSLTIMIHAHLLAGVVALAHLLPVLMYGREKIHQHLTALSATGLLSAPLALIVSRQGDEFDWLSRPDPLLPVSTVGGGILPAIALLVASLVLAIRLKAGTEHDFEYLLALATATLPTFLLVTASLINPMYTPRYSLVSIPGVALVFAFAISGACGARRRAAATVLVATSLMMSTVGVIRGGGSVNEDYRSATEFLRSRGNNVSITYAPGRVALGVSYYDRGLIGGGASAAEEIPGAVTTREGSVIDLPVGTCPDWLVSRQLAKAREWADRQGCVLAQAFSFDGIEVLHTEPW